MLIGFTMRNINENRIYIVVLLVSCILCVYFLWSNQYDCFWAFMFFFLLTVLVFIPIIKNGLLDCLFYMYQMNPLARILIGKMIYYKECKLSFQWLMRIEMLSKEEIPIINWAIDEFYSHNIDSFYCLDQYSDDVRQLLHSSYDVVRNEKLWFRAKFTNEYLFEPQLSPSPRYSMVRSSNTLIIDTDSKIDTWIYLVSKQKYPTIYALEFDYIPHTVMQETLQIGFCCHSLARRFRFNLKNNKVLAFEVVDKACFTYCNLRSWNKFEKKSSLPLHRATRIRLEVIKNIYAIYYDNNLEMAVRIKEYEPQITAWYLIFWNGFDIECPMNIEIKNLKIYTNYVR